MTLVTDCVPSRGTPEMVGQHFILVTILLQFESTKIIRLVVQLVTSSELHGNMYCHTRTSGHEI